MKLHLFAIPIIILAWAAASLAAPPINLELATERGVQITAPQEWLQLLAGIGIENVRIRGAKPGDAAKVTNHGTADRPSFEVVGILTARDQLRLSGGTFSRADRAKIKDYFDRLIADGAESLTAPRGMFGLTEKEIAALFADLAQPIDFETKGQAPRAMINGLQSKFKSKLVFDANAEQLLRESPPVTDELKGISAGTSLAIVLRPNGLVLRPEKSRGEPVVYRVTAGGPPVATNNFNRAGKTDDVAIKHWPIGWEPHDAPGRTAPSLFETLNAEIDGYTLTETLAAIAPRIKIPMLIDHASLAANKVDPSKVQIRMAKLRASYKLIIDRALAQARLGSQVRVDEAGNPFLWITR
jgi:hypothetical protein